MLKINENIISKITIEELARLHHVIDMWDYKFPTGKLLDEINNDYKKYSKIKIEPTILVTRI